MAQRSFAVPTCIPAIYNHTIGFFRLTYHVRDVVVPMLVTAVVAATINCGTSFSERDAGLFPRVEVVYEHIGWTLIHVLHRTIMSIVYHPVATDHIADVLNAVGIFVATVLAVSSYVGIGTQERALVVDQIPKSVMGSIFGHWAYVYSQIVMLIVYKIRVVLMDRKYPGRLPAQMTTPIFFCVQLCFILYYLSYWEVSILWIFAGTFVCVVTTTGYLIRMRNQFHVLSRQFDMSFFFLSAYHAFRLLTRTLSDLLTWSETNAGMTAAQKESAFTFIMLAYRTLVSFLVVQADETVEMAFGVNNMWISFPYRLAETVAVGNITLDKMDSLIASVSYLAINLLVTIAKDSGLIDDFRFLYINRFNVFYYHPPKRTHHQHVSASSLDLHARHQQQQPDVSSGPEAPVGTHGKDGKLAQIPDVVIVKGSMGSVAQGVAISSAADMHAAAGQTVSFAPSIPELSASSTTCQSTSAASTKSGRTGMVALRHPLHKITQDLRAQVMRSEQALVARLMGVVGYLLAFLVSWSFGFPKTRHVTHSDTFKAGRAVLVLLAEVVIARILSVGIFAYKIYLHEQLVQSMSLVGGKAIRSRTMTSASGKSNSALTEAHKSTESLQTTRSDGKVSVNGSTVMSGAGGGGKNGGGGSKSGWKQPIRLWTTRLPQHLRVRRLTVLGSVFIMYTMFGTWG